MTTPPETPDSAAMPYDDILYEAVGLITLDPQAWQNRPTFQQVVQVTSHR